MKNLLKISLVAMLVATPLIASADSALPVNYIGATGTTTVVPASATAAPTALQPNTQVATTSYVKGAYNEAIHHLNVVGDELQTNINTESRRAQNAETTLQTNLDTEIIRAKTVEGDLDDLSERIGMQEGVDVNLVNAINQVQANVNDLTDNSTQAMNTERARAEAAELGLDERLDVVEAQTLAVYGTWGSDEATNNIRLFPTVTLSPNNPE